MTAWSSACRSAARQVGGRFGAVVTVATTLSVLSIAALERRTAPFAAADNTLLGAVFGLGIPLCSYFVMARITTSGRLTESAESLARYGANRRIVVVAFAAVGAAASGFLGALLAAAGVFGARGASDPMAFGDAVTSAGLGILAGVVYSTWFALGSSFGRRGRGRFAALAVDWLLGSSSTAVALPLPRGHLRNLLGAEPLLDLSQRQASTALVVMASIYLAITLFRTPA